MRKVVATELVSLDGVTEKPQEWSFSYSNAEMEEANAAGNPPARSLRPIARPRYGGHTPLSTNGVEEACREVRQEWEGG